MKKKIYLYALLNGAGKFFEEVVQGKYFVVWKVVQGNTVTDIRGSFLNVTRRLRGIITSYASMMIS